MMADVSRVFTLLVDGKPTPAFEARNTREAQQLCKESWLKFDLMSLSTNGIPLWHENAGLSIRTAGNDEAMTFGLASAEAKPSGDMLLVYLIDLDGTGHAAAT